MSSSEPSAFWQYPLAIPSDRPREDTVASLRGYLAGCRAVLRDDFMATLDGIAYQTTYTFLIDQIITALSVGKNGGDADPHQGNLAIIAVGGYGRQALAPYSDIDLLFLAEDRIAPDNERTIGHLLYMLWDLGFRVGHSFRSLSECLRLSNNDPVILTSLLDRRLVVGRADLFGELDRSLQQRELYRNFADAKMAEREHRHERFGHSRYMLEPNIKDGKGGLRDLQTLSWIARASFGCDMTEAVEMFYSRQDLYRHQQAYIFLTRTRVALHLDAGRAEEHLAFGRQLALSELFRYSGRRGVTAVERFMRHFFITARRVGQLTHIMAAVLESTQLSKARHSMNFSLFRDSIEGFPIKAGRLSLTEQEIADDPSLLLKLFEIAQLHKLAIHPDAIRVIASNLHRIDDSIRHSEYANAVLLRILTDKRINPSEPMRKMNEAGILGRFIPDFRRIINRMQFDMYHNYTVDEHILVALNTLWRIEQGCLVEEVPIASEVIHRLSSSSRRILYFAVFLHDIAKGRGGDHSILGAEIANQLCPRFGLNDVETETVSWLVRWHLLMSRIAFKRDPDDPKTITDFIAIVQSPENLRLLLILTVADIRAVSPTSWTSWKAVMLRRLYWSALAVMSDGMTSEHVVSHRAESARHALAASLAAHRWQEDDSRRYLAELPLSFLSFDQERQVWHAELWLQCTRVENPLIVNFRNNRGSDATEVAIATWDQPGLMGLLAGAISLAGANILDAHAYSTAQKPVINSFLVTAPRGNTLDRPAQRARLTALIRQVLGGEIEIAHRLRDMALAQPARNEAIPGPRTRITIDNDASHIETVIEVSILDRPGLLWRLASCLQDLHLRIVKAKISTYGEVAVDVLFVRDRFGLKVTRPAICHWIQQRLLNSIAEDSAIETSGGTAVPGK